MSSLRPEGGGLPDPNPDADKAKNTIGLNRRAFLGAVGAVGTAGLLEYNRETKGRETQTDRIGDVLRGESSQDEIADNILEIKGKKLNSEQFVQLIREILGHRAIKTEEAKELMLSYSDMVEVEAGFGHGLNSLSVFEKVDPYARKVTGGRVVTANSFGYGQVNPESARGIALANQEGLIKAGVLTDQQILKLKDPNFSKEKIVEMLKLTEDENLIYGFLIFYEAYNHYGRDKKGLLHSDHLQDSRAFSLAVSAYSAKLESPRAAKIQTYLNEMLISDSALRKAVIQDLGWPEGRLMDIDGDLGESSLQLMEAVSKLPEIQVQFPKELRAKDKDSNEQRMQVMQNWLDAVKSKWKSRIDKFIKEQNPEHPQHGVLGELVSRRYMAANKAYLIIKRMAGEEKAKNIYRPFVEGRKGDFAAILKSKEVFEKKLPGCSYQDFIEELVKAMPRILRFDDRFSGYVPTAFGKPRVPIVSNPKNIFERVVRGHDMHPNDPSKIGLYPPRPHRIKHAQLLN